MSEKKKSAFTFKELLFAYLAISKLMYWVDNINAIYLDELGSVWNMIVNRLLGRDIMVIWILIVMFLLDHYISTHPSVRKNFIKNILTYGIGYLLYIASIVGYIFLLGLFDLAQIGDWFEFLLSFTVFYVIASVVLHIKEVKKKKEAEMYIPEEKTNEDSLAMLDTLHKRGVLTKNEYESKKAELEDNPHAAK